MRRVLISLTIIALLIVPQFAAGSDLDDFKAFNEKIVKAWNSFDAETIAKINYPGAIILEVDNPFPSVLPPDFDAAGLKTWFATLDYLNIAFYNVQYKVVGDTAVSWGFYSMSFKPKGGLAESHYIRFNLTAVKSGGEWKMLTAHHSAIPTGN